MSSLLDIYHARLYARASLMARALPFSLPHCGSATGHAHWQRRVLTAIRRRTLDELEIELEGTAGIASYGDGAQMILRSIMPLLYACTPAL